MTGLPRRLIRLALLSGLGAWLIDRWLRDLAGGRRPDPIRTSIDIAAPIERVWGLLADIEGQPAWMHDLRDVRIETPGPVGVGTRATGRVRVFGIGVEDPVEVTAFDAPTHFAIRHAGLVGGSGDIRLEPGDDGATRVTWEETLVAPGLPHLGGLVLAIVFRPVFQRDLERLAGLAEVG